ncbi:diguanylate cyclase/phosphodiesterase (GGDEF & EAL domains) with PAS/PAC sensor(s) [hydrothermal vent metagenome]|uniref:histidine kinase n=1 Tax=hydrothermal vent metagenome TaxID=652676 RepID=A0A3B1A1P5_9ZZZZ
MKSSLTGKRHSIARRLLVAVILMSTAITILTSAYQLYANYNRYIAQIDVRFTEIEKIHIKSLSKRLWTADIDALKTNLEEISVLPDIQYMDVYENDTLITSIGRRQEKNTITKTFPMTYQYKGKQKRIGTLVVQATLDNAYHQVGAQIIDILVSNAIKTFILAGFILYIFNHLITRHLETMADFAENLDITQLDKQLVLDRKVNPTKEADELEILVTAFTAMQKNLAISIESLQQKEAHYRQLVESTTAIPWEVDLSSWLFTYVGPQAEAVLGYPINNWYEKDFWGNHIHPDDAESAVNFCIEATKIGIDYNFEYRMITAQGKSIWIKDDVKIIYKDSKAVSLQGYMFDITEQKLNQLELEKYREDLERLIAERTTELLAANKELEAFSYSVSHDLRAPLRGIDGFSQILLEDYHGVLDETGLDHLYRIRRSAQSMGQIINDLLLLSRVTRQELQLKVINLSSLTHKSVSRLQENSERNVNISIEDNLKIQADENLVSIIIENLVGNAWKYTGKTPNANIEFGQTIKNNKTYFYIKDNGVGFNMEFIDKIFQPFQRLHSANEFDGTGIGLATVARVIHKHGGEIFAESEPDKGATFYFSLG